MSNIGSLMLMSKEQKKDWFVELGLVKDKAKILEWGRKAFPSYAKNENMMAQMWWTQHEGKVLPELRPIVTIAELRKRIKEFIDKGDTVDENGKPKRAWGNIEVLVVGPLGDSKPYFGCEKCTRGVDKNIGVCINDDPERGHPGEEVDGKMIAFQNWQAGDGTDEVIIAFAPNNKQTPKRIQGRVLQVSGSMNVRDGRYTVWEIIKNLSATGLGGSGANQDLMVLEPEPEPEPEVVEEVILDAETAEDDVSEAAEEEPDDGAEFFEDVVEEAEGEGTDLESVIPDYNGLVKSFEKSLERHVGTKKVPAENMRRFLVVRPQIRELPNREEVASLFLDAMVAKKLIKIDEGDILSRV